MWLRVRVSITRLQTSLFVHLSPFEGQTQTWKQGNAALRQRVSKKIRERRRREKCNSGGQILYTFKLVVIGLRLESLDGDSPGTLVRIQSGCQKTELLYTLWSASSLSVRKQNCYIHSGPHPVWVSENRIVIYTLVRIQSECQKIEICYKHSGPHPVWVSEYRTVIIIFIHSGPHPVWVSENRFVIYTLDCIQSESVRKQRSVMYTLVRIQSESVRKQRSVM